MGAIESIREMFGAEFRYDRVLLDRQGRSIELAYFDDRPCHGAVTLVTAGLSELTWHPLHEELLMAAWKKQMTTELQLILEFTTRQLAGGRERLVRGDVIGPAGPLTSTTEMSALYVCNPSYFDDVFFSFVNQDGHVVELLWLIPIHEVEARFIERHGAMAFEDELVAADPDLLNIYRSPIFSA